MQSQRLLSCLMLLQGRRRLTARELAAELDVSMRTVYRDVDALSAAGVPIHMERGPLGGIVLADDYRRALAQFTTDEVRALFATGAGPMDDLGITTSRRALQKLAGSLPAAQRRAIETSRERLFVDQNKWSRGEQPTAILRELRDASERDRRVRLHYRDREGSLSTRDLDPLGLVAKAGVWYLIAREADKGYRTFRAERIEAVDALPATFTRPHDFDLERYWTESVRSLERRSEESFEIVVRGDRRVFSRTFVYATTTPLHEDDTTATVRIAFPSRELAMLQMMVWDADVVVLEPAGFAAYIVERAREAIARFDVSDS